MLVSTENRKTHWFGLHFDFETLKAAVNALACKPDFEDTVAQIRVACVMGDLPFTEDGAALNEIVLVGKQNMSVMENLIKIAADKRESRAVKTEVTDDAPVGSSGKSGFASRNNYQRNYMQQRRYRERLVLRICENAEGPMPTTALRDDFLAEVRATWAVEKDTFLKQYSDDFYSQHGYLPSYEQLRMQKRRFWQEIDEQLQNAARQAGVLFPRTRTIN